MSLLLKIKRSTFNYDSADVPKMKSAHLSADDLGSDIYVWFADEGVTKSALACRTRLTSIDEIEMPQVRNPNKTKPGYRLGLATSHDEPTTERRTDDLMEVRYSEGSSGFDRLGRLHRDRNDKVIRLSSSEIGYLSEQFEGN